MDGSVMCKGEGGGSVCRGGGVVARVCKEGRIQVEREGGPDLMGKVMGYWVGYGLVHV